ncbi:MAG: 1,3-beta-glucanase [Nigerium sp.]|nr:1,3-beta-glucanase [Nigerium sp.]
MSHAKKTTSSLIAGALIGALAGCAPSPPGPDASSDPPQASTVFGADQVSVALDRVVQRDGKDLNPARLADGLLPPTNTWFAGLVFGATAQPVFPLPMSFGVDAEGFAFGLPTVTTTSKTIMGGYAPIIRVGTGGGTAWRVTAYDELSVTLEGTVDGEQIGTVRIAEGSPFVTFTAASTTALTTNLPFGTDGAAWSVRGGAVEYGLVTAGEVSGTSVRVDAGQSATWFAVPEGATVQDLAPLATDPVVSTSVAYGVADKATTTLRYRTRAGGTTAVAALPHQTHGRVGDAEAIGTYPSIFGTLTLYAGNQLSWAEPLQEARAGLDLSRLSDAERTELADAVRADAASAKLYPADTYFGGKALYRDAQLVRIAREVGADDVSAQVAARATAELEKWTEPAGCVSRDAFCFFYDTRNKGIVGSTPSFGSEEFNDHHFHYGYFLYAAGVLAADDPGLADRLAPVMDLLAADIATSPANEHFVARRNFDSYQSHSWASGTAPFADANNQESASEAITAYAGLTLWARASGNADLETEARWMHALEAASARAYWTDFDRDDPVYAGFDHTITPLVFGGKRDYATWFSAEPAAALAILLIPVSPSSDQLRGDPARIRANVAEGIGVKGFEQQYGDYLLMYSALAGEQERLRALEIARGMDRALIDDGNTYSYLLAWLLSLT